MITIIVGNNAIGKSAYLKNKVKNRVSITENVIYNSTEFETVLKNRTYNYDRIEELLEVLDAEEIIDNVRELTALNSEIELTGSFRDIVTVICREGDELYLDEPEFGLSDIEISYLVRFIYRILDTFKHIEIVTHAELFLTILEANKKTIVVKNNCFETVDIEGDAYAVID